MGVPVPADGYELDDRGWMAELAWPTAKIGIVTAPRPTYDEPDYEAEDRDKAFAAAGWQVRPAPAWSATELSELLGVQPLGRSQHRDQQDTTSTHGEAQS